MKICNVKTMIPSDMIKFILSAARSFLKSKTDADPKTSEVILDFINYLADSECIERAMEDLQKEDKNEESTWYLDVEIFKKKIKEHSENYKIKKVTTCKLIDDLTNNIFALLSVA